MRRFLICLLLAAVFVLLHVPLYNWWCGTGVGRLLGGVSSSYLNDFVSLVVALLGAVVGVVLPKRLSEAGNRWGMYIIGSLLFILVVQSIAFNDSFVHCMTIPWFRYTDCLIPFLAAFGIVSLCVSHKNKKPSETNIAGSHPLLVDDTQEVDMLGRNEQVEYLFKHLMEMERNAKGSVGIAVTGGWGTGKTWLMAQIRQRLEERGEVCIDFKPWLYGEVDLTRSFYQTLESQLQKKGLVLEELKTAITEIDNDQLVGFGRAFLSLFGVVTKNGGREHTVNQIKESLHTSNRKYFIFIDDCDRLAKKELLQVLSLIRNTGDFPGLVYLMAFDKKIVEDVIGEEMGMNYVGKMFNLSIDLPPINDDVVADYLNQSARMILQLDENHENPYKRVQICEYLPTIREAKKYLNLLSADFHRLKDRFGRYRYHAGDFCLLELLKYKYPDLYYGIESNPEAYLATNRAGWNSPALIPRVLRSLTDEQSKLLGAMFQVISDSRNPIEMIGVANAEYFPLYFDQMLEKDYLDWAKFKEALDEGSVSNRLDEWLAADNQGILGLICGAYGEMTGEDVFLSIIKYLRYLCEKIEPQYHRLDKLNYGYEKKDLAHGFKQIMEAIKLTPQVGLLTFQNQVVADDLGRRGEMEGMEKMIENTPYPFELMGIWLNELRSLKTTDYPYDEVRCYVEKLWDKLLAEDQHNSSYTLNILDVLEACTLEDTFERMVLPLVTDDPRRWLGATIVSVKDEDAEYYLLKSRAIQAIFGSETKMYEEMDVIEKKADEENKKYVAAYASLLYRLAALTINKNESTILDKYKKPASIAVQEFKPLTDSVFVGRHISMPIKEAIKQVNETPFWKGVDLRIYLKRGKELSNVNRDVEMQ